MPARIGNRPDDASFRSDLTRPAAMTPDQAMMLRLGAFVGGFLILALWERIAPMRPLRVGRAVRWPSHFALVALNNLLLRIALPVTALETAALAERRQWGLLGRVDWPDSVKFVLAVMALDLLIYLQHVMFHHVPLLWRLHRVHHADLELDVSSGVRFHVFEILLSMLIKCGGVLVIGPSVWAVLLFEVVLNATSMFNHSNIRLPESVDRWLRWIVVTPDMHRVHHSVIRRETNSNFGFNLPWWDRLLGTYRAQPRDGHLGMTLGLSSERDVGRCERLPGILGMPFTPLPPQEVEAAE